MGLLPRRRPRVGVTRGADPADLHHLEGWLSTRRGVEGFIEPQTFHTQTTLLLVAVDGEWTRRRVPSPEWAREFAGKRGLPVYDAGLVGIPDRMREWNRRNKQTGAEGRTESDGG